MQILNSETERAAFSLFTKEHSDEFRRVLCYLVAKSAKKSRQVNTVVMQLSRTHQYSAEDVKSALAVLKSPFAFNSLSIWTRANDSKQLCQYKGSDVAEAWFKEIETEYPHLKLLASDVH